MLVYLNGKIIPIEQANISLTDHGLLYGFGIFITVRAYEGNLFLIRDHLKKLRKGMKEIGIRCADGMEPYEQAMVSAMEANQMKSGKVRLTVTAGNAGWRMPRTPYERPNVFVFVRPLRTKREHGPKTLAVLKTPFHSPKVPYKTLSRISFLYAFRELQSTKADEGLLITESGDVAEGISSNIFIVRNGVIMTPPAGIGIVKGVTRDFVIGLAKRRGLRVKKRAFSLKELSDADEVFLTNSMQEIVPVSRIGNIFRGSKFPIAETLLKDYKPYTTYLRSMRELS